jgi:hypothetical protein
MQNYGGGYGGNYAGGIQGGIGGSVLGIPILYILIGLAVWYLAKR